MSSDRRKEIVRHLSMDDLDRLLTASTDQKLTELFEKLTNRLSFAASWIENHLGGYLQKLR
jgi:hypothetical protein